MGDRPVPATQREEREQRQKEAQPVARKVEGKKPTGNGGEERRRQGEGKKKRKKRNRGKKRKKEVRDATVREVVQRAAARPSESEVVASKRATEVAAARSWVEVVRGRGANRTRTVTQRWSARNPNVSSWLQGLPSEKVMPTQHGVVVLKSGSLDEARKLKDILAKEMEVKVLKSESGGAD